MKHILQSAKVILLALILSIGISYVSAWTAPTQSPPNGNTSAPLNVSTTGQVKAGGLGVSGLLRGYGNVIFDGNVGMGTTANSAGLKLDVEGNVGAVQYCDNNGANCVASGALGGGGSIGGFTFLMNGHPNANYTANGGVVSVPLFYGIGVYNAATGTFSGDVSTGRQSSGGVSQTQNFTQWCDSDAACAYTNATTYYNANGQYGIDTVNVVNLPVNTVTKVW